MKILKQTKKYQLNEGDGMADGLYNVSSKDGEKVSNWLFPEDAKELKRLNAKEFNLKCEELTK